MRFAPPAIRVLTCIIVVRYIERSSSPDRNVVKEPILGDFADTFADTSPAVHECLGRGAIAVRLVRQETGFGRVETVGGADGRLVDLVAVGGDFGRSGGRNADIFAR